MTLTRANEIELDYAQVGSPGDPAMVLIRGLGTQRIHWPETLISGLVERGLRVITLDNRNWGCRRSSPQPARPRSQQ